MMQKTGMLHDFYTLGDYEPFATKRIENFFLAVTPSPEANKPIFAGGTTLMPHSDFDLLDLQIQTLRAQLGDTSDATP